MSFVFLVNAPMPVMAAVVARTGSSRLPMKVLARVAGKPLVEHLIDRVKLAARCDGVVLCTTDLPADDPLEALAARCGISCFRDDPEDVPARLLAAARCARADFVLIVEADEVFTDPETIDQMADAARAGHADYIQVSGLPIGSWVTGVRTTALERVCAMKPAGASDAWGRYLTHTGLFEGAIVRPDPPVPAFDPDLRLTLDYPEDLALATTVFERLRVRGEPVRIRTVLELFQREPDLVNVNKHLNAVYWSRYESRAAATAIDRPS